MNYAVIKTNDIANGPGVRVSLFVSGCEHHCKGCFNEVAWDFNYGNPFNSAQWNLICDELEKPHVKGMSILGGEPLHPNNLGTVSALTIAMKALFPQKTIWLYTGYTFEEVQSWIEHSPNWAQVATFGLLHNVDVIVDGPFVESKKNLMLQFSGSENQRIINVPASLERGEVVLWHE